MDRESRETVDLGSPVKKRSSRTFLSLLLVLCLLSGAVFGLNVSGGLNEIVTIVSPFLEQIPFVGGRLVVLMDLAERPMNAQERRALELQETESALLAREQSLLEGMRKLKADQVRQEKLREELERERETLQKTDGTSGGYQEAENFRNVVRGFEDMSSRKAAGIISKLTRTRATEIMRALSQEKMAEILAKMDPATAAKMVEALSQES